MHSSSSSLLKLFCFVCLNGMCKVDSIPIYHRDQILYSYIKFFDLRPCITSKVVKFVVFHKQVLARCFSDLLFIIWIVFFNPSKRGTHELTHVRKCIQTGCVVLYHPYNFLLLTMFIERIFLEMIVVSKDDQFLFTFE